jgi:hypothetical protein
VNSDNVDELDQWIDALAREYGATGDPKILVELKAAFGLVLSLVPGSSVISSIISWSDSIFATFSMPTRWRLADKRAYQPTVFCSRPMSQGFGVLPSFLIVLDDPVDGLVEVDQQRYVAQSIRNTAQATSNGCVNASTHPPGDTKADPNSNICFRSTVKSPNASGR